MIRTIRTIEKCSGARKRGQAEMTDWIIRILFMAAAVVVIVMLVRSYADREIDSSQLGRSAYLYRLYYSDVIMYKDSVTGRIYPGVVDMSKLTTARLDGIFVMKEPSDDRAMIASHITATPRDGCAMASRDIYNNKDTYDANVNFAGGSGPNDRGRATAELVLLPVTLKDGGAECPGFLNITIVRPNT